MLDELARRSSSQLGADVERAPAALIVGGERDELEDPLDVDLVEPRLEQSLGRAAAHEPLRARAGIDPVASTPTSLRTPCNVAAAMPISVDHLLGGQVGSPASPLRNR